MAVASTKKKTKKKSAPKAGPDRRKKPRSIVRALVDYESDNTYLYDYSTDLSEGGIFIETSKPLKTGSNLTLRFTLPNVDRVFEVKGKVAWLNQERPKRGRPSKGLPQGMGVEFKTMSETDRRAITYYIANVVSKKA